MPVKDGDIWSIEGAINPEDKKPTDAKVPDPSKPAPRQAKRTTASEAAAVVAELAESSQALQQSFARSRSLFKDADVRPSASAKTASSRASSSEVQ